MNKVWSTHDVRTLLEETGKRAGFPCGHIPVEVSGRMHKTMGAFLFKTREGKVEPHAFRFAEILLSGYYPEDVVKNVIIHEYAHYFVNVKTGINHGHDACFKSACEALGIPPHTYFRELLPEKKRKGYILVCKKCGSQVARRRRIDAVENIVTMKVSGCCRAKIRVRRGTY